MNKEVIKDVGKRIAMYRKVKNLTQTDLAQLIGNNQKVIGAWEQGRADPGSDNIILLSKALGVTPLDLLGYAQDGITSVSMPDDSMEPEIHEGDVLTVDETAEAPDGSIVVADTKDHKGIIRKLFRVGVQTMLLAINPSVPPICVHYADIKGRVTDIHRKV